jgi:hypothetical protein
VRHSEKERITFAPALQEDHGDCRDDVNWPQSSHARTDEIAEELRRRHVEFGEVPDSVLAFMEAVRR